ncbi:beta-galactosidase [Saccharothrix deserti]|uniref:beta-galactosidase n=1 Tax=Saccharothrix deserti TaxID=2593674 RepID=UPI003B75C986
MSAAQGCVSSAGPYINAETDSGGLPTWLINSPTRDRSNEPDYIAAVDEWLDHINPIIARHQLTNGTGTVILYQNENEFGDHSERGVAYMTHLRERARADGITVPTFHNTVGLWDNWAPGTPGAPDLSSARTHSPNGPLFTAEFQGGSFDPWGGNGREKCRELTGPDFQRVFYEHNIAHGLTEQDCLAGVPGGGRSPARYRRRRSRPARPGSWDSPQISAVSMRVTPRSSARWMVRMDSASSVPAPV